MAIRYDIVHTTIYHYHQPVSFGPHRVMFRPRDSHDQRVLATDLEVSPAAQVRMIQDPHSNSLAIVQPLQPAKELRIVCTFAIEQVEAAEDLLTLDASAEMLPFGYSVQDHLDLEHYLRPHYDDPRGDLIRWAHRFLGTGDSHRTRDVLERMNAHIHDSFTYEARDEEGTQTPLQTLERGRGSCRDYALLMMEAVRRLGIAARFVSGYLYDPALDSEGGGDAAAADVVIGAGSTHAWLHAYLPGAGWVLFDPTNRRVGSGPLIRVGVARDPAQAAPVSGSWFGPKEAYKGLEATVRVTRTRT